MIFERRYETRFKEKAPMKSRNSKYWLHKFRLFEFDIDDDGNVIGVWDRDVYYIPMSIENGYEPWAIVTDPISLINGIKSGIYILG